jgi:crotonobetainyl-CoA:carnitine CoA-transferase CaiB-like acyl-CoA transferase
MMIDATTDGRPLPLAGVRVCDFSWIIAGPQATRILADLGAEVIKVENESYLDAVRGAKGLHNNFHRNKLGITASLHHPDGRHVVEALIARSDIVVENYSAGAFQRMGFGYDRLKALRPGIIYLSLSGYGHVGRDAGYGTWGPTAQGVSGATAMSGLAGHEPAGWGYSYLDHTAGFYGAIAALMALHHRDRTGEGQHIDMSQVETGMVLCGVPMLDYQVNGRHYERIGNHSRWPAVVPHTIYRCAGEDRWIAIAAENDRHWQDLCEVLGADDLAQDARFQTNEGRVAAQAALDMALEAYARHFDPHELMYALQARGVPAGACQTIEDRMEQDPQLAALGFYPVAPQSELGDHRFEGLPMRFSRARWRLDRGGPVLGEDTWRVLTELLGYSDERVAQLAAEAAV